MSYVGIMYAMHISRSDEFDDLTATIDVDGTIYRPAREVSSSSDSISQFEVRRTMV